MDEKRSNIRFNIMAILLIAIFCFSLTPKTFQNDTYYTIKIGEHILENGINMKDPFSFHDLNYTYPHWLYDVCTYLIYDIGGFTGLYIATCILTIILGLTIYLTNCKLNKNKLISFVITFITMLFLKDFIAARAQLVTFILFVLTIFFIEELLKTGKKKYAVFLIIIPILIANMHVAVFPFYFVLYLPYIVGEAIYKLSILEIIINTKRIKKLKLENIEENKEKIEKLEDKLAKLKRSYKKRRKNPYKIKVIKNKNMKILIVVMIIALLTGFLTPLGTTPYTYLIKTMKGDTTENISEHLPLTLAENTNFVCILAIYLVVLMFTDTKIRLYDLFMLAGLLVLTFLSKRQESMFLIINSFVLIRLLNELFNNWAKEDIKKVEKWSTKLLGMITIISTSLTFSIVNYKPEIDKAYVDETSYPVMACDYILEELDLENLRLYNEYNFGSYVLFRGIPVFIDSRADLYSPEFNKDINVFDDFLDISAVNCDVEEMFNKYQINYLLMPQDARLKLFIREKPEDYILIYEDDYFCLYERECM